MDGNLLIFVIVLLPIISACVGFTVHFAIRPMVEALVDALHEIAAIARPPAGQDQIARLEAQVSALRDELRSLNVGAEVEPLVLAAPEDKP